MGRKTECRANGVTRRDSIFLSQEKATPFIFVIVSFVLLLFSRRFLPSSLAPSSGCVSLPLLHAPHSVLSLFIFPKKNRFVLQTEQPPPHGYVYTAAIRAPNIHLQSTHTFMKAFPEGFVYFVTWTEVIYHFHFPPPFLLLGYTFSLSPVPDSFIITPSPSSSLLFFTSPLSIRYPPLFSIVH